MGAVLTGDGGPREPPARAGRTRARAAPRLVRGQVRPALQQPRLEPLPPAVREGAEHRDAAQPPPHRPRRADPPVPSQRAGRPAGLRRAAVVEGALHPGLTRPQHRRRPRPVDRRASACHRAPGRALVRRGPGAGDRTPVGRLLPATQPRRHGRPGRTARRPGSQLRRQGHPPAGPRGQAHLAQGAPTSHPGRTRLAILSAALAAGPAAPPAPPPPLRLFPPLAATTRPATPEGSDASTEALRTAWRDAESGLRSEDAYVVAQQSTEFHEVIADLSGNELMRSMVRSLAVRMMWLFYMTSDLDSAEAHHDHIEILGAI